VRPSRVEPQAGAEDSNLPGVLTMNALIGVPRTPFGGMPFILSVHALMDGKPIEVNRTWRERLCSWPWRPWKRTRWHVPKIPCAYRAGNTWIVHPDVFYKTDVFRQIHIETAGRMVVRET
jgi:hypothetical protein